MVSSKKLVWVLALLLCESDALTWEQAGEFSGIRVPSYLLYQQWEMDFSHLWNRSYDAVFPFGDSFGCTVTLSPAQIEGKLLLLQYDSPCTQELFRIWEPLKPAAIVFMSLTGGIRAQAWLGPPDTISTTVPMIFPGIVNPTTTLIRDMFPGGLVPLISANFSPALPLRARLDHPDLNPYIKLMNDVPSYSQFTEYFLTALALLTMLIAVGKLALFIQMVGKVRFSLPQVELALVFLGGFFAFLTADIGGGGFGVGVHAVSILQDGISFFSFFPLAFAVSAAIILGFYFGEVSQLTSAVSVPGLSKFRIPAIVMIAALWIVVIVQASFGSADPRFFYESSNGPSALSEATLAIFVINILGAVFVLAWGCISLIRGIGKTSGSNKSLIIRLVLVTSALVVVITIGGIWSMVWSSIPPEWVTITDALITRFLLLNGSACLALIIIALNFRISVAKEIEISKSATASTGGSSMSSSSSSSSSSGDPVIEL